MSNSRIWFLGAPDPEMAAIEALLKECGEKVAYATINGQRVKPHEAYKADNIFGSLAESTYLVECGDCRVGYPFTGETDINSHIIVIDHHVPSNAGYGKPAEDYLIASSIGQSVRVLARLGILPDWGIGHSDASGSPGDWDYMEDPPEIYHAGMWRNVPQELLFVAAADHCLCSAYQGLCPGVDPDELMQWRVESRAKFQGRSADSILNDIAAARKAIINAPFFRLSDDVFVRDLRGTFIPELPEASARENKCFIATGIGEVKKIVCQSGSPWQISAFMRWAKEQGCKNIYGDPERGFAGGIL